MVISPSEYIKKCLKIDFDNSVENIIDTGASIIIFEKGTMPIEMGEMINCFYFIIYGLVIGYYIDDDGNEVTKCFVYENGFFWFGMLSYQRHFDFFCGLFGRM